MKTKKKRYILLFIPLIILMIFSFLNMYNAGFLSSLYTLHLRKQIIWYLLGFFIIFIIYKCNIKNIYKYSFILYLVSIILLVLVLFFGKVVNGSRAWFDFVYFSFQPSELMKLTLALYLTTLISQTDIRNTKDEIKLLLKIFIIFLIPCILVFLEPDTGAIIFYIIITFSIILISKIRKRWLISLVILAIILIGSFFLLYFYKQDLLIKLIGTSFFYRVERLFGFTEISYQLENALTTIGSTTFFGGGLGSPLLYIPEAPTDFIFAFNIGNFGIFGSVLVLLSYFALDIILIYFYFNSKHKYTKYFLFSFIAMFIVQQVINIFMNIGFFPIIGIPLPFLSYGGTTILIYFIYLGIIINTYKTYEIKY